ncbi:MAG: lytic transglycosylase domain-containing protein [Burkholderiaceae bacterium]
MPGVAALHRGLIALACAALAEARAEAPTAWRCDDGHGHAFVLGRPLDPDSGMLCEPTDAPTGVAVGPGDDPAPPAVTGAGDTRRGGLVLAPAAGAPAPGPASVRRAAFDPLIESVAQDYGQDADLLRAIVQVESGFDPAAVSSRGAVGLMQVMPSTAADFGLAEPRSALLEPAVNLRVGAMLLRRLEQRFAGEPALVIAAYNAGPEAVVRAGGAIPPYAETQDYVRAVLAHWRALARARR